MTDDEAAAFAVLALLAAAAAVALTVPAHRALAAHPATRTRVIAPPLITAGALVALAFLAAWQADADIRCAALLRFFTLPLTAWTFSFVRGFPPYEPPHSRIQDDAVGGLEDGLEGGCGGGTPRVWGGGPHVYMAVVAGHLAVFSVADAWRARLSTGPAAGMFMCPVGAPETVAVAYLLAFFGAAACGAGWSLKEGAGGGVEGRLDVEQRAVARAARAIGGGVAGLALLLFVVGLGSRRAANALGLVVYPAAALAAVVVWLYPYILIHLAFKPPPPRARGTSTPGRVSVDLIEFD